MQNRIDHNKVQDMMSYIKLAEMRSTTEGHNLLIKLMKSPGLVVSCEDLSEDSLVASIEECGGKVWWCKSCDVLCFPNKLCPCGREFFSPQDLPQAIDNNDGVEDTDKITLMFSSEELDHVLRALKFCRHVKSKTKMNVVDQKWIDSLSKIINEIGE